MNRQLIEIWLKEPVTQQFYMLLDEHRAALIDTIVNSQWEQDKLGLLNQLKGQVNTIDMIKDVDTLFREQYTKEVFHDEEQDS